MRNRVLAAAIAFAPAVAPCAGPASAPAEMTMAARAAAGHKGVELGDLNRTVDACTDFYEFANGTWRAENPIPDAMPQWSRRVAAHEANRQRVQSILEDVSQKKDWAPGAPNNSSATTARSSRHFRAQPERRW